MTAQHLPPKPGASSEKHHKWRSLSGVGASIGDPFEGGETRKVGQREEKRTREAGTKMQCSTW